MSNKTDEWIKSLASIPELSAIDQRHLNKYIETHIKSKTLSNLAESKTIHEAAIQEMKQIQGIKKDMNDTLGRVEKREKLLMNASDTLNEAIKLYNETIEKWKMVEFAHGIQFPDKDIPLKISEICKKIEMPGLVELL